MTGMILVTIEEERGHHDISTPPPGRKILCSKYTFINITKKTYYN